MEKDDTIIRKVEEVLKSQSTNNIFLRDSTAVEVEGSTGSGSFSGNETQEDPKRRSFVGISGSTVEKLFQEFDFLEDNLHDVYDMNSKRLKKIHPNMVFCTKPRSFRFNSSIFCRQLYWKRFEDVL